MANFFHSTDADLSMLDGLTVAVIGYGRLGRSFALNLRDSGVLVRVGNREDSCAHQARLDGFALSDIAQAVKDSDIIFVLLPDEAIPTVLAEHVLPSAKSGATFAFASGYCLAFGLLALPSSVDVVMLAPRMLGEEVRRCYESNEGFVAYCSVEHDATGHARDRMLALAAATGCLQRGALELSAREEALLDLMIEQTVGPYLGMAMQMAFALGIDSGLPAEALVLELYGSREMAHTFDAFAGEGFYRSVQGHGVVATYGGFLRTLEVDSVAMRQHFVSVIEDIRSGEFAHKLRKEAEAGYPTLSAIAAMTSGLDPMSQAENVLKSEIGGFGLPMRTDSPAKYAGCSADSPSDSDNVSNEKSDA